MSNRYDYGYRGWNNWNGWNGYWKGGNPHWGYYNHYHHVPRRFGGLKLILTAGLAFWAGGAFTRCSLEKRNRGSENQLNVQQTPVVQQAAPVDQSAPSQQRNDGEFDRRKSWKSWRKCHSEHMQFYQCLNKNNGEIGACQPFFDSIKGCENKYL